MPQKKPLLLLHGALGSADQLLPLAKSLGGSFDLHCFTFYGHGGKGNPERPFRIEHFAEELANYLTEKGLQQVPVFGYSMGGYVALYLAQLAPYSFSHILTLGTKFDWSAESAAREAKHLQPAVIAEKVPRFAQALAARHQPFDWQRVVEHTADMMKALGENPLLSDKALGTIQPPVTIMRGSEDRMVSAAESLRAVSSLEKAQYIELQGQGHPLEQLDLDLLLVREIVQAIQAVDTRF